MSDKPLLQTDGLTKSYKRRRVVDGVSIHVEAGEIVGLLGPNGAGKTTLLRMVVGMVPPDRGTVTFDMASEGAIPRGVVGCAAPVGSTSATCSLGDVAVGTTVVVTVAGVVPADYLSSRAPAVTATLTIGDETWEFDTVRCAEGSETQSDEWDFSLSAIQDGLQLSVSRAASRLPWSTLPKMKSP